MIDRDLTKNEIEAINNIGASNNWDELEQLRKDVLNHLTSHENFDLSEDNEKLGRDFRSKVEAQRHLKEFFGLFEVGEQNNISNESFE